MCGIVGYVGCKKNCLEVLIKGLKNLEYRGYDSAGVAYVMNDIVCVLKESGKLENLEKKINFEINSNLGIGHTRWATHGKADKINAHPHQVGKFTVVHNGIIENYNVLRKKLEGKGYQFKSSTDTEVVSALLDDLYKSENNKLKPFKMFL